MLWNHSTIASLSEYLAKKLVPQSESEGGIEIQPGSMSSVLDTLFDSIESTPTTT